jgi:hypothetical protein
MAVLIRWRGRQIQQEQVSYIQALIAANPQDSRRRISQRLCEAWAWRQPNGELSDMLCRGLLATLERAGLIELPPRRCRPPNPLGSPRARPARVEVDRSPIESTVKGLGPLEIVQVRRTEWERLYNSLIEYEHYLGYCHPVGEQLKYVVFRAARPIGCLAFSSSPRHLGCRDRFIGWTAEQRRANIRFLAYNTRFLILPWVRVPHLASHLLGRFVRQISRDWISVYRHPLYLLETFVDTERFAGTCYRAAGWQYLGLTTGRGKADQTGKPNRSIKAVWGYPLHRDFRRLLATGQIEHG